MFFFLPTYNSRRQRQLKRADANASALTGVWGVGHQCDGLIS